MLQVAEGWSYAKWSDTLLPKRGISLLPSPQNPGAQSHPLPHILWALCKVDSPSCLGRKLSFSVWQHWWYLNIPVIGEGGTTFLFVFLKNPSSGLLKKYFRVRKDWKHQKKWQNRNIISCSDMQTSYELFHNTSIFLGEVLQCPYALKLLTSVSLAPEHQLSAFLKFLR